MNPTNTQNEMTGLPTEEKHSNGRWTKEEHQRFVEAIKNYGKNWKKVEDHVATRSGAQIRSHAQKFFLRLEKELKGKHSNQKDKGGKQTAPIRKFSEGSISTYQTQPDDISDSDTPEEVEEPLKDNLPIQEAEAENQAETLPSNQEALTKDKEANQLQEKESELKIQSPVREMQREESAEQEPKESGDPKNHLLSKLQNSQEKQKDADLIFNLLTQYSKNANLSDLHPPTNSKTFTSTSRFRSPISGELHPHHSVYIDLMNYFSKYNKNSKNLKLSDMVEISPEKSTSDDESYEMPSGGKRIKQL